ncbi:hypothetical protein SPI_04406 [Niveomyces insectorum RCEF 264]|uniref:Nuclear pore protein n=1 Tax=Niveomyces insectorum RCEF 264 TaxID=1081102 RepID=A0A167VPY5_9HYPO|nr:hypothetical protein SPI_04406 [Niveomyces insectorum RCEF 264]
MNKTTLKRKADAISSADDVNDAAVIPAGQIDVDYLTKLAGRASREIDFDDGRGDVKLIVKNSNGQHESFAVSSAAMARACKPWDRMLNGSFGEARTDHPKIFDFTEDGATALTIIMSIIHFQFSNVPQSVELPTLADLARLTDKYMLTTLVAPWLKAWIDRLRPTVEQPENGPSWLWIAWEYGLADVFNKVSHNICQATELWCVHPAESASSSGTQGTKDACYSAFVNGVPLPTTLPLGAREAILAKRRTIISAFLRRVFRYLENLRNESHCPVTESLCQHKKRECLLVQIGSLYCALLPHGLLAEMKPSDVYCTPSLLEDLLSAIEIPSCQNFCTTGLASRKSSRAHKASLQKDCGWLNFIQNQMKRTTSEPIKLTDAQTRHIEGRKEMLKYLAL